jgi:uncharacterized protein YciI
MTAGSLWPERWPNRPGAVLIFRGDNPQAAHDFVSRDPYVKNKLITEWTVRPWIVVTV